MDDIIIRRIDTSTDGFRFYEGVKIDAAGKEERVWCYPSVTTKIGTVYPKDSYLINWIRDQGIGGQAIFEKAADEGTEVHVSIDKLIRGESVPTFDLSLKVKRCVQAFIDWATEVKPKWIESEEMIVNHQMRYAGTRDLLCEIDGETWVIDYKTSTSVHDEHRIQLTAYWKCTEQYYKCAILHLGNRTKKKYSFLDFDPRDYEEQLAHYNKGFELAYPGAEPKVETYPESFKL